MTMPRNGAYPRPWTTDSDPTAVDVLIVGASSAKKFYVADVGSHEQFLDGLWNRNGRTCRAMYDAATKRPSRTRGNLDRLSAMLAVRGLTSMQTNVSCASAPYDAEVSNEDRIHGTELFKAVVEYVPWKVMIVYGAGASEALGRAFGVVMPMVPDPQSPAVWTTIHERPVYVSPTLAYPAYRSTVWTYLSSVVAAANGGWHVARPSSEPISAPSAGLPYSIESRNFKREEGTPATLYPTAANQLVWRRMKAVVVTTGLKLYAGTGQARLDGAPELSGTTRVFRHGFVKAKPDLLLREDVFAFDPALRSELEWTTHSNPIFLRVRSDDLVVLDRIMAAVKAFGKARAP